MCSGVFVVHGQLVVMVNAHCPLSQHTLKQAHLVPFPSDPARVNALLPRKGDVELGTHLLWTPQTQLVKRVFKDVLSTHTDAQRAIVSVEEPQCPKSN